METASVFRIWSDRRRRCKFESWWYICDPCLFAPNNYCSEFSNFMINSTRLETVTVGQTCCDFHTFSVPRWPPCLLVVMYIVWEDVAPQAVSHRAHKWYFAFFSTNWDFLNMQKPWTQSFIHGIVQTWSKKWSVPCLLPPCTFISEKMPREGNCKGSRKQSHWKQSQRAPHTQFYSPLLYSDGMRNFAQNYGKIKPAGGLDSGGKKQDLTLQQFRTERGWFVF